MMDGKIDDYDPPDEITFEGFPKIARWNRDVVVTEKLDGTNAQVIVMEDGRVAAASRTRLITPEQDNFGFARWVQDHAEVLRDLGPGRHYGEWVGKGIQRGYGLLDRHFVLFNTTRWNSGYFRPACCDAVPVLYSGGLKHLDLDKILEYLRFQGSLFAPGFPRPEGIVIWHEAARQSFKITLDNDDAPKGTNK